HRDTHYFPTRRSSDLAEDGIIPHGGVPLEDERPTARHPSVRVATSIDVQPEVSDLASCPFRPQGHIPVRYSAGYLVPGDGGTIRIRGRKIQHPASNAIPTLTAEGCPSCGDEIVHRCIVEIVSEAEGAWAGKCVWDDHVRQKSSSTSARVRTWYCPSPQMWRC